MKNIEVWNKVDEYAELLEEYLGDKCAFVKSYQADSKDGTKVFYTVRAFNKKAKEIRVVSCGYFDKEAESYVPSQWNGEEATDVFEYVANH